MRFFHIFRDVATGTSRRWLGNPRQFALTAKPPADCSAALIECAQRLTWIALAGRYHLEGVPPSRQSQSPLTLHQPHRIKFQRATNRDAEHEPANFQPFPDPSRA
jgi:hypothetical protein